MATSAPVNNGVSLDRSVRMVFEAGGIPVLPWSFGKWSLGRRKVLDQFLSRSPSAGRVFLGDNGCRPHQLGTPRNLALASSRGLRVLAGSDPLPFPDHEERAASYGNLLAEEIDWQRPGAWLRARLSSLEQSPRIFGQGRSFGLFLHDQLRIHRRRGCAA